MRYAVTGRRNVPKMSLDELGLFASAGSPRLVLVTCGGRYDAARHSYEDNVVVQARPAVGRLGRPARGGGVSPWPR